MMTAAPQEQTAQRAAGTAPLIPVGVGRVFILVTGLFLLWGVPNNLNDILIPHFMKSFAITRLQAGLVQSAFYMGYFLLALPAGLLIRRSGYKAGFLTGLVLYASGCFLFLPAANSGRYAFFLTALFVLASGLAFLETAANPFIAQLGPSATSEQRLNLAQAFNPFGAILGAVIGTKFILSGVELTPAQAHSMQTAGTYTAYLHQETLRVVMPYLVLGTVVAIWAVMLLRTRFPAFIKSRELSAEASGSWRELLGHRHFLFSLFALFMYVGAQVGTWSYFIRYAQEFAHTPEKTAGYLLTGTLSAFCVGRFSSAFVMRRVLASRLMMICAGINFVLLLSAVLHPGWAGVLAILSSSFFMSMMFPTIFALGLKDLGPNTNIGGSLLVMMIIGGAVITPLMGGLAEHFHSTAVAYQIPLYGYVVVAAFSAYMTGYTIRRDTSPNSTFEI